MGKSRVSRADKVLSHLRLREGDRERVYLDSLGKLTCGVGHLLTSGEVEEYPWGVIVPEDIRNEWLRKDCDVAIEAARRQVKELGLVGSAREIMLNALVSVNFQLGTSWRRKFPGAWRAMCNGEWDKAIDNLKWVNPAKKDRKSLWFQQTPVRVFDFIKAISGVVACTR